MIPGRALASVLVAGIAMMGLTGCTKTEEVFPANGTLGFTVINGGVQRADDPAPGTNHVQVTEWTFESVTVDVPGVDTYDFLSSSPCLFEDNVLLLTSFTIACGIPGIALATSTPLSATVQLDLSKLEVRRAYRPDLPDGGDFDGDGVLNEDDNCPIIANPPSDCDDDPATPDEQCDSNPVSDGFGDACSAPDANGDPFVPDSDADGVPNLLDNCLWVANADQADTVDPDSGFIDFIGDACVEIGDVELPGGLLQLDLGPQDFVITNATRSLLVVDFDSEAVLTCDWQPNPATSTCTIDPAAITLSLSQ